MSEPRYVLRVSHGGRIDVARRYGGESLTEYLIMDSWDCYKVVWRKDSGSRRRDSASMLDRLNAEHDAAMLAPMQAATVGEAEQARKGTGS